jgi:hypothetical protein
MRWALALLLLTLAGLFLYPFVIDAGKYTSRKFRELQDDVDEANKPTPPTNNVDKDDTPNSSL